MIRTMRARFSKGDGLRYISHLDLQRMFGRALRRARIPIAYSQGFNPHPRLAFGSALGVGTTSESEFLDIDLNEPMTPDEFMQQMNGILPEGLRIEEAHLYELGEEPKKLKTLMSVINAAEYEIYIYPETQNSEASAESESLAKSRAESLAKFQEQLQAALHKINLKDSWVISRFSKKKERELDIKPFVYQIECITEADSDDTKVVVRALVKSGSEANVRPDEIIEVLRTYGELPEAPYQIHRKNLGIMEEQMIKKPFLS
ncbi:TIGR03936 family radical SAM-associated protein [Desulfuribacillus alkaliarsenatis]|uniref:DUF2344 domain-containing protein n=1 Tax=Desulfuribacillus alkaliarsenatis TaxID=766136 RepID=A0A1E5G5H7_9FIRM|nr:TIGR03936 family radical SAM-associated protein [Desulfuribacillus alkaliarsenatis]OEF98355.1 hypothetical protein BHF68_01355 [Desulfuribacillus alkaliarsenatis]